MDHWIHSDPDLDSPGCFGGRALFCFGCFGAFCQCGIFGGAAFCQCGILPVRHFGGAGLAEEAGLAALLPTLDAGLRRTVM
jgi:hypothetical protein